MKTYDLISLFCLVCKTQKKWGLYLSGQVFDCDNGRPKAAPYIDLLYEPNIQCAADNHYFILCDSEDECYDLFNRTVGDDGPTELNDYDGPDRIYALVVNPEGLAETENT